MGIVWGMEVTFENEVWITGLDIFGWIHAREHALQHHYTWEIGRYTAQPIAGRAGDQRFGEQGTDLSWLSSLSPMSFCAMMPLGSLVATAGPRMLLKDS